MEVNYVITLGLIPIAFIIHTDVFIFQVVFDMLCTVYTVQLCMRFRIVIQKMMMMMACALIYTYTFFDKRMSQICELSTISNRIVFHKILQKSRFYFYLSLVLFSVFPFHLSIKLIVAHSDVHEINATNNNSHSEIVDCFLLTTIRRRCYHISPVNFIPAYCFISNKLYCHCICIVNVYA